MARLDRILDLWSRALLALAIIAGLAMMVHVTLDAAFRYFLNAPIAGTSQTVAAYYMIAVAFLPIALLGREDEHITVDVFTDAAPRAFRVFSLVVAHLLGMAWMAIFSWQAWVSAMRRMHQGEVLEIPGGFLLAWPARFLLPVAGASLLACLALRLIQQLRALRAT